MIYKLILFSSWIGLIHSLPPQTILVQPEVPFDYNRNASWNEVCPGGKSECEDGETCCPMKDGSYGCCPYKDAECCADQLSCCPHHTKCNLVEHTCEYYVNTECSKYSYQDFIKVKFSSRTGLKLLLRISKQLKKWPKLRAVFVHHPNLVQMTRHVVWPMLEILDVVPIRMLSVAQGMGPIVVQREWSVISKKCNVDSKL